MMPVERQMAIAAYAAGASLAAITLVYVLAPTYFTDGDSSNGAVTSRKKGVAVGLSNLANDCFINSVLQALAGLPDLRIYLVRENHQRKIDDPIIYETAVEDPARKETPEWKTQGLQGGILTAGLKVMLDALNERPTTKKTISAYPFIVCLEKAFRQRISRQQQDAQEFLQVVAERLCDEYHAGQRARLHNKGLVAGLVPKEEGERLETIQSNPASIEDTAIASLVLEDGAKTVNGSEAVNGVDTVNGDGTINGADGNESASSASTASGVSDLERASELDSTVLDDATNHDDEHDEPSSPDLETSQGRATMLHDNEEGFPLEGKSESQIECLTCGFKPKPSESKFCTLTLHVPQTSSTTLNECFDGVFKTEYIDDFKCEKCRLVHAMETYQTELTKSTSEELTARLETWVAKLEAAIKEDPEQPPEDVELPDSKLAPQRKIARHVRITQFPKVIAIHLSRSIFDLTRASTKNSAKVEFPELLPLGSIAYQRKYRLLGLVTHKGSHSSGHYESFRRQYVRPNVAPPAQNGVYNKASTPKIDLIKQNEDTPLSTPGAGTPVTGSSVSLNSPPNPPDSRASVDNPPGTRSRSATITSTREPLAPPPAEGLSKRASRVSLDSSSFRAAARSAINKVPSLSGLSSPTRSSFRSTDSAPGSTTNLASNNGTHRRSFRDSLSLGGDRSPFRRRKPNERWWKISDERVRESKTSDVLGMQREVYLLFYELVRGDVEDSI